MYLWIQWTQSSPWLDTGDDCTDTNQRNCGTPGKKMFPLKFLQPVTALSWCCYSNNSVVFSEDSQQGLPKKGSYRHVKRKLHGTGKRWVSILRYILYTLHRDRKPLFSIGAIVFYCGFPGPCPCPGPMQCVWAIRVWLQSARSDFLFQLFFQP